MLNIKFEPKDYLDLERKPKPKKQLKYVVAFNHDQVRQCLRLLLSGVMGPNFKPEFIRKQKELS